MDVSCQCIIQNFDSVPFGPRENPSSGYASIFLEVGTCMCVDGMMLACASWFMLDRRSGCPESSLSSRRDRSPTRETPNQQEGFSSSRGEKEH